MRRRWSVGFGAAVLPWLPDICKAGRAFILPIMWLNGVDPELIGAVVAALEFLISALERLVRRREQEQQK